MNLYFLLEGKTEPIIYPKWLNYLLPDFQRVISPDEANDNNYFMISGKGFPSLLHNHLEKSIEDINEFGNYDFLVVAFDAEENTVQKQKNEVINFIQKRNLKLKNCNLEIIIQNRCIETWLLGNNRLRTENPLDGDLRKFIEFYDVTQNCPESMGFIDEYANHATFHHDYLKKLLIEKNVRYSKTHPGDTFQEYYLQGLLDRIKSDPTHINSFREFINLCDRINNQSN